MDTHPRAMSIPSVDRPCKIALEPGFDSFRHSWIVGRSWSRPCFCAAHAAFGKAGAVLLASPKLSLLTVLALLAASLAAVPVAADASIPSNAGAEAWFERCNIPRIGFKASLMPAKGYPYIAKLPEGHNALLAQKLQRHSLLEEMGNATCTPSQAGNVRRGIHEMELREYVETWMQQKVRRNSEENKYVFGEFGEQWAPLRDAYDRPPCSKCKDHRAAVTIGLGGLHSGAPWHFHNAVFVEVLHGAKHFALLPPGDPAIHEITEDIAGLSQWHWHLEKREDMERTGKLSDMIECTIHPGELLYFPDGWHHGVVNMAEYTAFVSTFVERDDDAHEHGPKPPQPSWIG